MVVLGEEGVERSWRMAAAARGTWVLRRWMSQSTSSSRIKAVSRSVERNQVRAFRWPIQANADPFLIRDFSGERKASRSSAVHFGWSGMVSSMPVRFAAKMRSFRRGEVACDTARTAPNPKVAFAGTSPWEGFNGTGSLQLALKKK